MLAAENIRVFFFKFKEFLWVKFGFRHGQNTKLFTSLLEQTHCLKWYLTPAFPVRPKRSQILRSQSPTQNQFISRQKGTEVSVLISIQHIIWQGLPFTLLLPLTTYGHKRGRTAIKCWVREDRKCVREMKEINITSAGCWAGQLVDNECVPLQSGNKRLLLTPASTSRSPAHLIILQSNAHTQQSTVFTNI